MESVKVIYVPWYVNEWVASTSVMSNAEYRFYHSALMQYYLKGRPLTRVEMARLVNEALAKGSNVLSNDGSNDTSNDTSFDTSIDDRKMIEGCISEHFYVDADGLFHNQKADEELEKIASKSKKAKESVGKRIAKNGRSSNDTSIDPSNDASNDHLINNQYPLQHSNECCVSASAQTPPPKRSKAGPCPEDVTPESWDAWNVIRKQKRNPMTAHALDLTRKECAKVGITLQQAVDESILHGWSGFTAEYHEGAKRMPNGREISVTRKDLPSLGELARQLNAKAAAEKAAKKAAQMADENPIPA